MNYYKYLIEESSEDTEEDQEEIKINVCCSLCDDYFKIIDDEYLYKFYDKYLCISCIEFLKVII